jgi:hypothetical protein
MGNNWYYVLFFESEGDIAARLEEIFCILNKSEIIYRKFGCIKITSKFGIDELEFSTQSEARDYLAKQGGALQVWKIIDKDKDWDVDFEICIDPYDFIEEVSQTNIQEFQRFHHIVIKVGGYLFQDFTGEQDRITIARFIHQLYTELCDFKNIVYGFSLDENLIDEEYLRLDPIIHSLTDGKITPNLFWLNYFSDDYPQNKGLLEDMQLLNFKRNKLRYGTLYAICDFPWQVDHLMTKIKQINVRWTDIHHLS